MTYEQVTRRARNISRSLGIRTAAGFLRNQQVPLELARFILLKEPPGMSNETLTIVNSGGHQVMQVQVDEGGNAQVSVAEHYAPTPPRELARLLQVMAKQLLEMPAPSVVLKPAAGLPCHTPIC